MSDVDIPGEKALVILHPGSASALGKGKLKYRVVPLASGKYGDLSHIIGNLAMASPAIGQVRGGLARRVLGRPRFGRMMYGDEDGPGFGKDRIDTVAKEIGYLLLIGYVDCRERHKGVAYEYVGGVELDKAAHFVEEILAGRPL